MTNHHRQLITDLNTHLTKISLPYQCRKSLLSYGIWNSSLNMIEIIYQHRSASKCFLTIGIMKNSKLYLYPEEAIFMMQCSLLQVSINNFDKNQNIPISLNEAYSLWLNQSLLTLKHLHVYQYLTRIGFILIRHRSTETMIETKIDLSNKKIKSLKRKRDEYEQELIESPENELQNENYICPIHLSSDCRRQWFPNYTDDPPIDIKHYPRLLFPDTLSPVHIDWLPSDFNSKVSNVQLSIYQNNKLSIRPSYSLLRSIDLQSHRTIYQRLSSFFSHSNQAIQPSSSSSSSSSSNIFFDMYTPRKHFRKSQPGLPDYYIKIKNGNDEFNFEEIYNEQQTNTLTAVVHNGDPSFYLFKPFNPIETLL
ncbi:unnamed protein product [Rotaria sordida]|uniref:tRNA-splicing endonuclease subunit Sen54 N-terminal domain-containing protein n=1 Tax=Rotaria sordida TaxID=392033 RepID=A0A819G9B2_9BILA|nr:unnamed protein product [Rotaria sordida]CAF0937174.1 unnamed protein product [Rotaria sordida]CAF3716109.1 unnamed protein product [Rotaria sordida]CAF3881931.1 unnamed protein product [Rotaria sordida]